MNLNEMVNILRGKWIGIDTGRVGMRWEYSELDKNTRDQILALQIAQEMRYSFITSGDGHITTIECDRLKNSGHLWDRCVGEDE